ncbi:MAG TPA: kynureninase [Candidatus Nanopelagicaceae bacterium]|nr:kynureninase [Candidatus Nanopelagicaceae bacterium]
MFETEAARLDAADSLAEKRQLFAIPEGISYLDGNSLGALPKSAIVAIDAAVRDEWGEGLIRSWNTAGWVDIAQRVGNKIAALIGAVPDSVVACDSTSVNLYKALHAACGLRPDRSVILTDVDNFPTDLYLIDSVAKERGLRVVALPRNEIIDAINQDVAVLELTHVDYRSSAMYDMADITGIVHRAGALTIWDLAHSAGAVPLDVTNADADFAVGCGYKYLNGGPGAPAFIYVSQSLSGSISQPIHGWHGHARPFEFSRSYEPAAGVDRMLVGTPPVLSMTGLSAALDIFQDVSMSELRAKSLGLSTFFYQLAEEHLVTRGLGIVSERDSNKRGSHVALSHSNGYSIIRALIERGVVGDFRRPDILRFGFAPLYNTYADVARLVSEAIDIIDTKYYLAERFTTESAVV